MLNYKTLKEAIGAIVNGSEVVIDTYGRGGKRQLVDFQPDPDLQPELREQESLEEILSRLS